MPRPRPELHAILRDILGSKNVYFQPPSSISMKYPCIVYERSRIEAEHADNKVYKNDIQYTVTAVYLDPDSDLPLKLSRLPKTRHSSHFVSDNLYHDVFAIYF